MSQEISTTYLWSLCCCLETTLDYESRRDTTEKLHELGYTYESATNELVKKGVIKLSNEEEELT